MENIMIQMNEISKSFDNKKAIQDLTLNVQKGEIFGFLGPSGSGKTTTLKILTGQLGATSGDASILGKNIKKVTNEIYSEIGIVTDKSGLYKNLTVFRNLEIFAEILGINKERIHYLLDRVGLKDEKQKKASQLSTGMRQRLVLARALLHNPKILFLDEPTSGLDPSTALGIHKLLLEMKAEGTTFFLTTHNMEEATKLCDRVALLNDGQIKELGTPRELSLKYNDGCHLNILLKDGTSIVLENGKKAEKEVSRLLSEDLIETIHSSEPNLEQVFIKVTGRELQ